ncbi:glycine dehydrogenase [Mycobacterium ulcerans subsp. shinshuense]|uniref:glycine dehydrogenase (aminomethyl-transferring) n=1 Tax=Mycobacterium ulcerans subsp. shinshuense TaxID=1124626 RepID=A0A1B4Y9G7_MYCUL|nr:glycine dehydrogenase [Mycobacterium ulcerans subsp. shinshuense]
MSETYEQLHGGRAVASSLVPRHIGPDPAAIAHMLATVGYPSLDDLIDAAVPARIRNTAPMALSAARTEQQVLTDLASMAERNTIRVSMIGQGYSPCVTPEVPRRNLIESPAWYTAYTPYQPEISQGRLEALLTFQTMIEDLTGLPLAGASLLDEATAVVEAMLLMRRSNKSPSARLLVDSDCFTQTLSVLRPRAAAVGIDIELVDIEKKLPEGDFFGIVLQAPGASGAVRHLGRLIATAKARGAMTTVAADLLSLTLLTPPGELGADIAVGSAQRFGVPLFFGGPHAGYMAVRSGLERALPGRLVGVSKDVNGAPAYRLALQTREQHIRRDKATSNICTAQALLANVAAMYAVYHGPEGLRDITSRVHAHAVSIAASLRHHGYTVAHDQFFDTVLVEVPGRAGELIARAESLGINLRRAGSDHVGISCDETTTTEVITLVLKAFDVERIAPSRSPPGLGVAQDNALPAARRIPRTPLRDRHDAVPAQALGSRPGPGPHHDPAGFVHHEAQLRGRNGPDQLAGVRGHPPARPDWADHGISGADRRSRALAGRDHRLRPRLAAAQRGIPGRTRRPARHSRLPRQSRRAATPNLPDSAVGSWHQRGLGGAGRHAGGRGDHRRRRQHRPSRPARAKISTHSAELAAIMLTYPSTHGVYEPDVTTVCDLVHKAGGQVYIDGANLNALVGIARPGHFGGDVSHLNLHKTFCIPHGGGGPGVGPVAVRAHLAPFLPDDPHQDTSDSSVAAANYGSAGILPITWAYIALMGPDGLATATKSAVLSANYLAARLNDHYPVLYTGPHGLVAHECILDLRELTRRSGVTAEDVAKRLIDYGFHALTLAFPASGTLMVEPTESEDLAELDRFVDAMVAIRGEIDLVMWGECPLRPAHCAKPRTPPKWCVQIPGTCRTRAVWPHSRRPGWSPTSTGLRCGASMAYTAIATWSARARRQRPSSQRCRRNPLHFKYFDQQGNRHDDQQNHTGHSIAAAAP